MSKGIDRVRKSITQRKKMRQNTIQSKTKKEPISSLPNEEEKHGYLPVLFDQTTNRKKMGKRNIQLNRIIIKAILALFIFIGAHFLLQTNNAMFLKPKELATNAFTEELPFARMYMWYQDTFGTPLAFTADQRKQIKETKDDHEEVDALPVTGTVTEEFDQNGKGIFIAPDHSTQVSAWKDGVIIFAGNDSETDKTIIVQHADQSKSTYGHLSSIDVHLYQFIPQNKPIGTANPTEANETIYFSLEKNNEYMDPSQVIQVDDVP